jgi:hypothetical protein
MKNRRIREVREEDYDNDDDADKRESVDVRLVGL